MALTKPKGNMIDDGVVTNSSFVNTTITTADMAVDPRNASNLSSGSVPLAQLSNVDPADYNILNDDIAVLGFKIAANGSLSKYSLIDQTVDAFESTTGIDASTSTNETYDSSGKYYYGEVANTPTVTGGTISTSGIYTFHYFTSSGNFVTDATQALDIALIGGGGAGGRHSGGGGGAGGLIYQTGRSVAAGTYAYVHGPGGATQTSDGVAPNGSDSTWNGLTAKGGGGGGYHATTGNSGGSGGGSSRGLGAGGAQTQTGQAGDSGTYGFGNAGGSGNVGTNPWPAAGGGGAGAAGGNTSGANSGPGGAGKDLSAIFGSFGVSGFFAGGGGGQTQDTDTHGSGGSGGGGDGGAGTPSPAADGAGRNGVDYTGSGGGGSSSHSTFGTYQATGGDGTLIIRRPTNAGVVAGDMTLVSTSTTARTAPTKGDLVMTYTNGAGTAAINTDLTAEFSADNGSTWTSMTLAAQGTSGGHSILTANNITRTSTSGTSMRYRIKTLNQSASKETRIQAVSLGWS